MNLIFNFEWESKWTCLWNKGVSDSFKNNFISLLLVTCVCFLQAGMLHQQQQKKSSKINEKGSAIVF